MGDTILNSIIDPSLQEYCSRAWSLGDDNLPYPVARSTVPATRESWEWIVYLSYAGGPTGSTCGWEQQALGSHVAHPGSSLGQLSQTGPSAVHLPPVVMWQPQALVVERSLVSAGEVSHLFWTRLSHLLKISLWPLEPALPRILPCACLALPSVPTLVYWCLTQRGFAVCPLHLWHWVWPWRNAWCQPLHPYGVFQLFPSQIHRFLFPLISRRVWGCDQGQEVCDSHSNWPSKTFWIKFRKIGNFFKS